MGGAFGVIHRQPAAKGMLLGPPAKART